MSRELRILLLEDEPVDAEMVLREVRRHGIRFSARQATSKAEFLAGVREFAPDLILADYTLPGYDGLSALAFACKERPEAPFIFVSGSLGEEKAIEALHQGATDYVLKHRLSRLGPAVRRALLELQERRLREGAEQHAHRLATAVEQAAEAIAITDVQGALQYVNPAFERVSGYERGEVLGRNLRILKSGQHDQWFYTRLWNTVANGEVWHGRFVNKRKNGLLYEEDSTISPIRDDAGRISNYVSVNRDVSHELQLEAQLRQAQKMEAIGQLAGGVAHDFNNLLGVISGNAELVLRHADRLGAEAGECLRHVIGAADRAAKLTRQLLLFSRKQAMQSEPVALNELIGHLTRMLKRVLREDIHLECVYADGLPFVQADPGMLEQALLNLVVNARDAMPAGGRLVIATDKVTLDASGAQTHRDARPGEFVCLSVRDTGTGIAPEHLPRIFEPFFTTKGPGQGTGLGLATVYGIVQQQGGWIELSSLVGAGTTFKLFLPSMPASPGARPAQHDGREAPGGTETILVVEDDRAVRLVMRRLLENAGYTVLEAACGREALEVWGQQAAAIALLLTDIVMPEGMTGGELAKRLRAQRPELKTIFMSGYSPDALEHDPESFSPAKSRFLQKPCSATALLRAVRDCLDGK